MRDLRGRAVWLTGASGGIGAALARTLARRGRPLALFSRDEQRLEGLREEILASLRSLPAGAAGVEPPAILIQRGDVTDRTRVLQAVAEADEALGGIGVAILNAGIGESLDIDRFSSDLVRSVIEVNFFGAVHGIEGVLPRFLERGRGTVVGISSMAGFRGLPQSAPYCASKAALSTFLESLRVDLAPRGIGVITVSPGFVKTPLTDRNRFPMPFLLSPERAAEIIVRGIEKGRRTIDFPWQFALPMKLLRLAPPRLYDALIRRFLARRKGPFKAPGARR